MGHSRMRRNENSYNDFSQPFTFHLQTRKPDKTIDIGKNGVSLSLDAHGRVLQASTFHPEHGIIVAVPFEQFDGTKFYDSSYVRSYRTRMLQFIKERKPGFGLNFAPEAEVVGIRIHHANMVSFDFVVTDSFHILMIVCVLENGEISQTATVTNNSPKSRTLPYDLNLYASVNRASYGQLTEGGPIPLPESRNLLRKDGDRIINVVNPALDAQLACILRVDERAIDISSVSEQEVRNTPLNVTIPGTITVPPGASIKIRATFRLTPDAEHHPFSLSEDISNGDLLNKDPQWKRDDALTTYILRRNVDYILANCIVPISETETCVITDHVALPLGWNRDNYWQIRLLLETHKHLDTLVYDSSFPEYVPQIQAGAKGHLTWVYKTAKRPHGFWHRSYLVTGKPKDHAIFQLDQQCYPLLELCDYLDYFPGEEDFVRSLAELGVIDDMVQLLDSKRDPETGLLSTDETPGDDAVTYPYHFSSHILLWRTLSRLRDLFARIYPQRHDLVPRLTKLVDDLHTRTLSSFAVPCPDTGKQIFAYLTNGRGAHTLYHDANDIPTFFALEWGFVSSPNELATWRNTLDFAFSPSNSTGYCAQGPYAGLGSVHSPGAWVLGYFQEMAYATWRKDGEGLQEAWRKIAAAMQWDGTFSEAVDPYTAKCSSKAWFSWPGAMIGALIIKLRIEGMEDFLSKDGPVGGSYE